MAGKLGVHGLVLTDDWSSPASARAAIATAAKLGFELIEVLVLEPTTIDATLIRRLTADAGIEPRVGMALGIDSDISSADPETARRGEDAVARCLEIAAEIGAPAVSGITYAAFNAYTVPPSAAQRGQVAAALARLDRRAGALGVKLGLEPVNRYESYLVNTLDQAAEMIRATDARNLFVHMDTFHMNIEESDVAAAITRNAGLLGYAHVAESHRGLLGSGSFDFPAYFRALAAVGYGGDYTVETFSPAVLGPDIVGAVKLWRTPWADREDAARHALQFMRAAIAAAKATAGAW
jgi:D-psicose/D-tagatose/L-ribulose 3-epimerase